MKNNVRVALATAVVTLALVALWRAMSSRATESPTVPVESGASASAPDQPGLRAAGAPIAVPEPHRAATLALALASATGLPERSTFLVTIASALDDLELVARINKDDSTVTLSKQTPRYEIGDVKFVSTTELHFHVSGLREEVVTISVRRLDRAEPFLFSAAQDVALPTKKRVRMPLGVDEASGQLVVSVTGPVPLKSARVRVLDSAGELVLSRDIGAPRSGPNTTIRGILVVPAGEAMQVELAEYKPGWRVLGLPPKQPFKVGRDGRAEVAFETAAGTPVSFSGLDVHGESLPFGCSLWRRGPEGARFVPLAGGAQVTSDARVWKMHLLPGRYSVHATPKWGASGEWRTIHVKDEPLAEVFSFGSDGSRASISFVGHDGAPLPQERVNLNRIADALEGTFALPARTDTRGILVTPPIPSGRYRLMFWDRGLSREIDITGDYQDRIELPEVVDGTFKIEGRVELPASGPVHYVWVHLEREDGWSRIARTAVDGAFEFKQVLAGDYRVHARKDWYSDAPLQAGATTLSVGAGVELGSPVVLRME